MNAEADDKQKPVESSQRSTESRAGAETESNNSPPQSFTGVPSIWKFLGTVAIAGGALAAIAGFIQTVGYQARPDATLAIVVGIVSIGFGIFLRTLR